MVDIVQIYAVHQDDNDRSNGHPAWFFKNEFDASAYAVGKGWYGGKAPVMPYNAILAEGQYFLLQKAQPIQFAMTPEVINELKRAALKKLTAEDKHILGLSDDV